MGVYYAKGTYNVECLEAALQTSSKGDPMIALKVKVLASVAEDGSFVPEDEQYERRIYMVIKNEEESLTDIAERLRGAGWNGTKFEGLPTEMVGLQFAADCWHAMNKGSDPKYAGQMQESWALWSPNRRESKPLENKPSVAKDLNNLLGKVLKNTPVVPKPQNQEQSRNHAGRGDDAGPPPRDEIPF
jgi:hypothetical protein